MATLPPGLTLGAATPTTRGRSVLTTRAFGPGDLIATFLDPSPSVVLPDTPHLAQTCSYCLLPSLPSSPTPMRACSGCRTAHYCTPACQRLDWALAHGKGECKAFRRVRASELNTATTTTTDDSGGGGGGGLRTLPTPTRALLQVLLRRDVLAAFAGDRLESHAQELKEADPETWGDIELQARAALHFLREKKKGKGKEGGKGEMEVEEESDEKVAEAVDVLCKLRVNSFNRLDTDLGQSGIYINPALAMVNHSCVPNAFVQFVGRNAMLHAFQDIKAGEEIEISYIDCTLHRSQRQTSLKTRYHFDCACPRCTDDLDVYQVCQQYPHLPLNAFSLVPDLDLLRHPPIKQSLHSNSLLRQNVEEIYPLCSEQITAPERTGELTRRWKLCGALRMAGLFAIEPLASVLVEASLYFSMRGKFASGLTIASFLALHSDPYKGPMPFYEPRVKRLFVIAKLLANTASIDPSSTLVGRDAKIETKVFEALDGIDQATMCQVILRIVVHHCPAAHSTEWQVYREAKGLLDDIESLPGREQINALIDAFSANPDGEEERRIFDIAVLDPIKALAGLALEVMDAEFGT